jgi:RNA polymerase sigma factor (sigma-70 family)
MSQFNMLVVAESRRGRITAEDSLPDGILLDRFISERDALALETLIERHAPRVLRVCRQTLNEIQDAEDACQATFLVLIHRANAIRESDNVGGWLCGVARRVAARAKIQADRRRRRESAVDVQVVTDSDEPEVSEVRASLRAEVNRLPEKYRRPIELCYWEGLSSEQAAVRLECPTGTLKWRLARARELLRSRLGRAGLALVFLFIRRAPSANAAAVAPGNVGRMAGAGSGPGMRSTDGFSAEFLQDTLAMAAFVRDFSSTGPMNLGSFVAWKSQWLGRLALVPLVLIVAVILGSLFIIPSVRRAVANSIAPTGGPVPGAACH